MGTLGSKLFLKDEDNIFIFHLFFTDVDWGFPETGACEDLTSMAWVKPLI